MIRQLLRAAAIVLAAVVPLTSASPSVRAADEGPKAFSCRFDTGHSWTVEAGKFKSDAPAALAFDITEINLDAQSAKLISAGSAAPGTVRIVRALNANHFLEVANEGFLNLTTIYDLDAAAGAHPAVHSRHFGLMGQPIFAQYAGLCTPK
jgi:hypothetical protein